MYIILKKDNNGTVFSVHNILDIKEVAEHLSAMIKFTPEYELVAVIKVD